MLTVYSRCSYIYLCTCMLRRAPGWKVCGYLCGVNRLLTFPSFFGGRDEMAISSLLLMRARKSSLRHGRGSSDPLYVVCLLVGESARRGSGEFAPVHVNTSVPRRQHQIFVGRWIMVASSSVVVLLGW